MLTSGHLVVLIKEYLIFSRIIKNKTPPETGDITPDNMPGRRKKIRFSNTNTFEPDSHTMFANVSVNGLHIKCHQQTIPAYTANLPVSFTDTDIIQGQSKLPFSYLAETSDMLSNIQWATFHPKFGHFLQSCKKKRHHCKVNHCN